MTYHVINFRQFFYIISYYTLGRGGLEANNRLSFHYTFFFDYFFFHFANIFKRKMLVCRLYNVWLDDISVREIIMGS